MVVVSSTTLLSFFIPRSGSSWLAEAVAGTTPVTVAATARAPTKRPRDRILFPPFLYPRETSPSPALTVPRPRAGTRTVAHLGEAVNRARARWVNRPMARTRAGRLG